MDVNTGTFMVARDHVGIVPCYIGRDNQGAIYIANELKVIHDQCI